MEHAEESTYKSSKGMWKGSNPGISFRYISTDVRSEMHTLLKMPFVLQILLAAEFHLPEAFPLVMYLFFLQWL
jgi:hypothetical protein